MLSQNLKMTTRARAIQLFSIQKLDIGSTALVLNDLTDV